jgi:hypothetical protein
VLPYLLLCREDSPQRKYDLRTVFDAVRYVARTGGQWRFLPHDLPPWYVVYQQMQRWLRAGCFELLRSASLPLFMIIWSGFRASARIIYIDYLAAFLVLMLLLYSATSCHRFDHTAWKFPTGYGKTFQD